MKKTKQFLFYLSVILLLSFFLIGCNSPDIDFKQGRHESNEHFRYSFDTYTLNKENIEFNIEETLYNADKNQAQTLFDKVKNDYDTLNDIFKLETTIKIYVVKTGIFAEGGFYSGGKVYCKLNDINELSYRKHLTAAVLETTEPWKIYGAHEYAFENSFESNSEFLTSYYNDKNNLMTLSLFAAYFNDNFADSATLSAAQKTAQDYGKYLIDNYGTEYFLNARLSDDYRQEWLDSIGSIATFNMPYDLSWLDGATYSSLYLSAYPLVITTPTRVYNLAPIPEKYGNLITDAFNTPLLVLSQLSECNTEVLNVLSYLEVNAPLNYSKILSKYNEKIFYYISSHEGLSYARMDTNSIYLYEVGAFVHETIHIIASERMPGIGAWLDEGSAEYFSVFISERIIGKKERIFLSFSSDWSNLNYRLVEFGELCKDYYLSQGKEFTSLDEFDYALLYEAIAATTLTNPNYLNISGFEIATTRIDEITSGKTGYEGNDLTYPEAYLFTKYLIDNYGLDTVLSLSLAPTYNFEEYFNKTYDEVFSSFLQSLQ